MRDGDAANVVERRCGRFFGRAGRARMAEAGSLQQAKGRRDSLRTLVQRVI